jgi:hypothetical protein
MKTYIHKLVDGTDDQYKVSVHGGHDRGLLLCGDQLDEVFVKLYSVIDFIDTCEGDVDFLKFRLKEILKASGE